MMNDVMPQPGNYGDETDEQRRDRVNAFVASDAFSDFALECFKQGVRLAIAEQIAKGVIDRP